jgi:class 3 adenylate cyclase
MRRGSGSVTKEVATSGSWSAAGRPEAPPGGRGPIRPQSPRDRRGPHEARESGRRTGRDRARGEPHARRDPGCDHRRRRRIRAALDRPPVPPRPAPRRAAPPRHRLHRHRRRSARIGDLDSRRLGTGGIGRERELHAGLAALAARRGSLPPLDEAITALQPADASLRLARRDVELLSAVHAQERAWLSLSPWLLDHRGIAGADATADADASPFVKAPLAELADVAHGAGFVNFTPDQDGGLRVVRALRPARGAVALQLGLAAARAHLDLPADAITATEAAITLGRTRLTLEDGALWLVWPTARDAGDSPAWLRCATRVSLGRPLELAEAEHDLARQALRQEELAAELAAEFGIGGDPGQRLAAVREEARFRVDDADALAGDAPLTAEETAELQPFRDFLAFDRVHDDATAQIAAARAELAAALSGKLVFIGWTATGAASDFVPTPLASRTPGVVAHAVAADMALSGRSLTFAPRWMKPVATIAVGLLATLAALPSLWLATPLVLLLLAGWVAVTGRWFAHDLLVLPMVAPLMAGSLSWVGAIALEAALARRNQQRITRQFKARTAPELVDFLVDHPEALSMAGEPRKVTCFFVDLAGFTSLSERLGARKTVALLNHCMKAMTTALTARGAYVNKFLGDGLMAFWSAFRTDPDQATHACLAALAAQEALATVIDPKQVTARMGIATGRVIVGDCGAPPLLHDYTAIGDAINLSSRLESANKLFGTKVLVDGDTRRQVSDPRLRFRPCGRVVVVGQTTPVDLFELVPGSVDDEQIAASTRAVESFAAGRREEARERFAELERRFGPSKLAQVHLDALEGGAPLDGVLHLRSK